MMRKFLMMLLPLIAGCTYVAVTVAGVTITTDTGNTLVLPDGDYNLTVIDPEPPIEPPVEPPVTACDGIPDCQVFDGSVAWKTAIESVPKTGGTIIVMPGSYAVIEPPWISRVDSLTIIGVPDLSGDMPTLYKPAGVNFNAFVPWQDSNGDLTIVGVRFDGGGAGNCIYSGSKSRQQNIVLDGIELVRCGHGLMGGQEYILPNYTGTVDDRYLLKDVTCSMSGTHCIYIDRSAYTEVSGGVYHSPGYHALKILSRDFWIHDAVISNVQLDGSLRPDGKKGAAPIDGLGCQRGLIENNDIRFYWYPGTGNSAIVRQPRWSIKGCEIPPYPSTEFWSEAYWQNPDTFEVVIRDNVFTLGPRPDGQRIDLVTSISTAPIDRIVAGQTQFQFLPRPEWWRERSVTTIGQNVFNELNPGDRVCHTEFWGQMVDMGVPTPAFEEICRSE